MIEPVVLRELRAAAGDAAVLEHDPVAVDGARIGVTLVPSDADALAAVLAVCSARSLPLLVRGGGSRLGIGNRPRAAAACLSTAALVGCEVDPDEGVARVAAGTPLSELAEAARAAGWRSPLEAIGPTSTLGGALATAGGGPRALGLGRPRDVVLGLEVVLASGAHTRCGGRVVKNVSGYDLAKLYVGSFGTLGVITGAWLRLRPQPQRTLELAADLGEGAEAAALAAARRPGAQAAALLDGSLAGTVAPGGSGDQLVVELAGDESLVAEARAQLEAELDVRTAPGAVDALRALEGAAEAGPLRFRIAAPPSAQPGIRARLHAAGADVSLHPGLGQALAFFALEQEDESRVDEAWRAARAAPEDGDEGCILERAPAWAKEGRDVFDARPSTLPLMRALKQQFDPEAILNPGRFVGGI